MTKRVSVGRNDFRPMPPAACGLNRPVKRRWFNTNDEAASFLGKLGKTDPGVERGEYYLDAPEGTTVKTNITRETFLDLLAAVENICPAAEPGNQLGVDMTWTALETVEKLFDMMDREGAGHRAGVLTVVKLLAEVTDGDDQEAYAEFEAALGWAGKRRGARTLDN